MEHIRNKPGLPAVLEYNWRSVNLSQFEAAVQ